MSKNPMSALLLAAALGTGLAPAQAGSEQPTSDEKQARQELEQAREELQRARQELERAARDLANSYRDSGEASEDMAHARKSRENAFNFWMNPKRAMLGVIIGPGEQLKDKWLGTQILGVTPGSGADDAGLKVGDLIISVDGKAVVHDKANPDPPEHALGRQLGKLENDQKVAVEIKRDGKTQKLTVVAKRADRFSGADREFRLPEVFASRDCVNETAIERRMQSHDGSVFEFHTEQRGVLGLDLVSMDANLASYFKTQEGLLVIHAPEEGTLGLRGGDVILKINAKPVTDPRAAIDKLAAQSSGEDVTVDILRNGSRMMLKGSLPSLSRNDHRQNKRVRVVVDRDG